MKNNKEWKKQEITEFWTPEVEGDELIGTVKEIRTHQEYGRQYLIMQEDKKAILTPAHKVLQNRMIAVKEGDEVKIVYLTSELPKVKGHSPTKMYDVFIKTDASVEMEKVED